MKLTFYIAMKILAVMSCCIFILFQFHDVTLNGFWEAGCKHIVDSYAELFKEFSVAFHSAERLYILLNLQTKLYLYLIYQFCFCTCC